MSRLFVLAAVCLVIPSVGLGAGLLTGPPGGSAPKNLVGTWRTTLTAADVRKESQSGSARVWELVIVNSRYLSFTRALGLRPAGSGGDTVPFAVAGNRIRLSCLVDGGQAGKGYGTYTWTIVAGELRFKLVGEPCKDPITRDRIIILTSRNWHRT